MKFPRINKEAYESSARSRAVFIFAGLSMFFDYYETRILFVFFAGVLVIAGILGLMFAYRIQQRNDF